MKETWTEWVKRENPRWFEWLSKRNRSCTNCWNMHGSMNCILNKNVSKAQFGKCEDFLDKKVEVRSW